MSGLQGTGGGGELHDTQLWSTLRLDSPVSEKNAFMSKSGKKAE